jgi:hypothetical protein
MSIFRKKPDPWEPQERFSGLSEADFNTLARYNTECAHGIMHTLEWQEQMAALQARFNAAGRAREWTLP